MKRYGIFASLMLLFGIAATDAQAASTELDINLGCVAVATKDVSIKTGDCGTRRRVEYEHITVIKERPRYYYDDDHHRHSYHNPGKGNGKNKKYVQVLPPPHHHDH